MDYYGLQNYETDPAIYDELQITPEEAENLQRYSLYLADDTLLWQSDLIKPGKTSAPITLSRPLDPGAYPGATLRYACFRLDREKTPLNGAETKLTLWVQ